MELVRSSGGAFEVTADGDVVYSKKRIGRHAQPGEVLGLLRQRPG